MALGAPPPDGKIVRFNKALPLYRGMALKNLEQQNEDNYKTGSGGAFKSIAPNQDYIVMNMYEVKRGEVTQNWLNLWDPKNKKEIWTYISHEELYDVVKLAPSELPYADQSKTKSSGAGDTSSKSTPYPVDAELLADCNENIQKLFKSGKCNKRKPAKAGSAARTKYDKEILAAANEEGVPPGVIKTLLHLETSFNPREENKREREAYSKLNGKALGPIVYHWGKGLGQYGANTALEAGLAWYQDEKEILKLIPVEINLLRKFVAKTKAANKLDNQKLKQEKNKKKKDKIKRRIADRNYHIKRMGKRIKGLQALINNKTLYRTNRAAYIKQRQKLNLYLPNEDYNLPGGGVIKLGNVLNDADAIRGNSRFIKILLSHKFRLNLIDENGKSVKINMIDYLNYREKIRIFYASFNRGKNGATRSIQAYADSMGKQKFYMEFVKPYKKTGVPESKTFSYSRAIQEGYLTKHPKGRCYVEHAMGACDPNESRGLHLVYSKDFSGDYKDWSLESRQRKSQKGAL